METNRQNYVLDNNSMQHMNVAGAGEGVVGGLQAEVVSGVGGVAGEILGGKYDEHHEVHDGGDDDELKYVEEVQQSEKQQQQQLQTLKNFGLDDDGTYESNELAEKETSDVIGHGFGNENGGFVFGGDHQIKQQEQQHDFFKIGNGHDSNGHDININDDFGNLISTGFEEKLSMMESEIDILKNEGDSYTTSNVTESAEAFVPQIDVKIEAKSEQHEMADEEEPSSLATNTTNGTSSLSENVPPQAVIAPQANAFDNLMANIDDKDNLDSLTKQKPYELDLDQAYSQLIPDAKEFIPGFGSNPASPTSPFASENPQNEPVLSDVMETHMYFGQNSSSVPPHLLLCNDDFVAHSPSKEKGENNMDDFSLPVLSEFEKEADKRPRGLELTDIINDIHQTDEVMTPDQAIQQLPLDDLETQDKENKDPLDFTEFHPSNNMDHGPETCVDLETDLVIQNTQQGEDEDDVMKRSMYVMSDDGIEDVLNSVQPLPIESDSINNSFIEESATESAANQLANDKELLQVEEKEHVSNSPSTEELQMNLQNTLNSSNKDIPQLPIDMDNANNMQESIYIEKEEKAEVEQNEEQQDKERIEEKQEIQDETLPMHSELNHSHEILQHDFQEDLPKDYQTEPEVQNFDEPQQYQEDLPKDNQTEPEVQHFGEHQQHEEEIQNFQGEFVHEAEQHFEEQLQSSNELHYDQKPIQDLINEPAAEAVLADTTNPLIENVSFLDNVLETQELEHEIKEVSNISAIESLNLDAPVNHEESVLSDAVISLTEDESYLPEETREQHLLLMPELEQQISEMMLENDESNLSQAEEVAATTATIALEDMSENLITSDEAVVTAEHYHKEEESTQEQMFIDDSFNQHEQECEQHQQLQELQQQEMNNQIKQRTESEPEIESLIEQEQQQGLESEIAVVEEPIIEPKQAASLFTMEETKNVTESEDKQELPLSIVPETAVAETLEHDTTTHKETENLKSVDETAQQVIEEVKVEPVKEPAVEELKTKEEDTLAEAVKTDVPVEAVIVAATAAAAIAPAVAAKVTSSPSKTKGETVKNSVSKTAATKPKVVSTTADKKPAEVAKKPVGLAAKPRTATAKPSATAADRKPIGKTTTTTTTTAARKVVSATTTTASKVVAKTASATSSTVRAAAASKTTSASKPATAPRTASSNTNTAARKLAATNGTLTKQRPVSAPTKPTSLGLSATNGAHKAKSTSPRESVNSNVRKISSATTATKSPVKLSATNGVSKTAAVNVAARTKSTTTVSSTAGTAGKTFTARPAPKFTSSSSTTNTTATTKGSTRGGSAAAMTSATKIANSTPLRKSTPTKPVAGKAPTKSVTTTGGSKSKTPIAKTTSPPSGKPAPIRKPVDKTAAVANGEVNAKKELIAAGENEKHQLAPTENGEFQAVQLEHSLENGDSCIPMPTEKQQQSFLEPRDEQIPMDLINA